MRDVPSISEVWYSVACNTDFYKLMVTRTKKSELPVKIYQQHKRRCKKTVHPRNAGTGIVQET